MSITMIRHNLISILLILLFLLSLSLRFYRLGSYPPLLWDEAALGYNAYSLLQTGKDEYGATLPLVFKSFGDYKPGLYVYLALPSVALFGLNPFSVRFPSALLGSLTPLLLFLFLRRLKLSFMPSYLAGLFLALSPFAIHFSRGAWETNVLTFFLLLLVLLFSQKRYVAAAVTAGLSLYVYQSAKLLTPLVVLASLISFPPKYTTKNILNFILPLFIISLPLAVGLLQADSSRLKVVSLFSYPPTASEINQTISESGPLDYSLFHNRLIHFGSQFLLRYFNHLSPRFLFTFGDWQNPRHSAPYTGLLLLPTFLLLPLGLVQSRRLLPKPLFIFFGLWLLFAPIPSALTRDSVSAVRAQSLSVPLALFTALGFYFLFSHLNRLIKILGYLIVPAYLFFFVLYLDAYYHHLVKVAPFDWLYGNRQVSDLIISNQSRFSHIYYSDFYGQPYIFYLFYCHYPPARYQSQARLIQSGPDTGTVPQIDNITFGPVNFSSLTNVSSVLAVFSFDEVMRQGIDLKLLTPVSPINSLSTYYAYIKP